MRTIKIVHTAKDTDYFTVKEAADELKINAQSIRDYLVRGLLTTYKFKTFTLLKREEVEEWKKRQK